MKTNPSNESSPPDPNQRRIIRPPSRDFLHDPLQLGLTIVGITAAFGGAGWWIDSRLHTFPFLMVLGAVAGLFGVIYTTVLRLRQSDRTESQDTDSESGNGK